MFVFLILLIVLYNLRYKCLFQVQTLGFCSCFCIKYFPMKNASNQDSDKDIEVEILDEVFDGELAWIKYSTTYDGKTGIFKLTKENGQWKVTNKGPREKGPF